MHPRMNSGEPDPRLAAIIARLRELPAEERPPYGWAEFSSRAMQARHPRLMSVRWRYAAAGAGAAAIAIIAVALWTRLTTPGEAGGAPTELQAADSSDKAQWH